MSSRKFSGSFALSGYKIAIPALALIMAAVTLGLGESPAWARSNTQGETTLKMAGRDVSGPERQRLFAALDQWMNKTKAAYNYDIGSLQDPFLPIKEVRGNQTGKPAPSAFTQLKLVAITVLGDSSGSSWALFEDGAGHGHILRPGDRFGRNNELVVSINSSTVRVEEPARGPDGRARITDIKLASPGSLAGLTRSEESISDQ